MRVLDLQHALANCNLVKRIYYYPELNSTMTRAWELIREACGSRCDGTLVIALHQSSGRGRQGRIWVSQPGKSLLFSLVLVEEGDVLRSRCLSLIPSVVSVALCQTLRRYVDATIKYPNDIVCNGRKIAGILIERATVFGNTVINIGIGINVGHSIDELPPSDNTPPTSLFLETGLQYELEALLAEVCIDLHGTLALQPENVAGLLSNFCSTLGKPVTVSLGDSILVGIAEDINASGALIVNVDGVFHEVNSGEIVRLHHELDGQ